jgi:hypothetical protein
MEDHGLIGRQRAGQKALVRLGPAGDAWLARAGEGPVPPAARSAGAITLPPRSGDESAPYLPRATPSPDRLRAAAEAVNANRVGEVLHTV